MAGVYGFSAQAIDGRERSLSEFEGQVLLIVNVASACGFTPQYEGLQALYARFHDRGFSVLGFPCNQFGAQESGDEATICSFAEGRFGVTFPMFAKVEVNGPNAHPLWAYLQAAKPGLLGSKAIKWNFTKFLVDRRGRVAGRYAPSKTPAALAADVERLL